MVLYKPELSRNDTRFMTAREMQYYYNKMSPLIIIVLTILGIAGVLAIIAVSVFMWTKKMSNGRKCTENCLKACVICTQNCGTCLL